MNLVYLPSSLYEALASLANDQRVFTFVKTMTPALLIGTTGSLIGNSIQKNYPTYSALALGLGLGTTLLCDVSCKTGLRFTPMMAFSIGLGAYLQPSAEFFANPAYSGNKFVKIVDRALTRSVTPKRSFGVTEVDPSLNDGENQLVVRVGDISKMGGILVNSANRKLMHGSGVAAALQSEYEEMQSDKEIDSELEEGDLVASNASNVYNFVMFRDPATPDTTITSSLIKILKHLSENHPGLDIVIPFFGCGQFGFNKSK